MTDHRKTLQQGTPEDVQPDRGMAHNLPPASSKDRFARSTPPPGTRTPAASLQSPDFRNPLPSDAPDWMLRARRLSLALEQAISTSTPPSAPTAACIERAWAAWQLDGSTDRQIARVAGLVERAHDAIREAPPERIEQAYHDVAQVVWAGLPRNVKSRTLFDRVVQAVREMRLEADPWAAAVDATSRLLGWSDAARSHAAHAIRTALITSRTG